VLIAQTPCLGAGLCHNSTMDEETKAYLDAMMVQLNNKFERILDEIGTLRSDFQNTKGFLLGRCHRDGQAD